MTLLAQLAVPALVVVLTVVVSLSSWFGWWLVGIIKADGYGFRAASGLPRDWAPPELPSTPYAVKPHR